MSTFNKPASFEPTSSKRSEDVSQDTRVEPQERPSPEKVSPSQQGKFLGALEKKEKKKEGSLFVSGEGSDEEEKVDEKGGLFGLASVTKAKARRSLSEKGSGGEEEEPSEEEHAPPTPQVVPTAVPQAVIQPTALVTPAEESVRSASKHPRILGQVQAAVGAGEATYAQGKEKVAFKTDIPKGMPQPMPTVTPAEIRTDVPVAKVEDPKAAREAAFELINQAIDAMTTMVSKGETTTVITIRQPPIFEGASLTITESATAKKEFNLTFGNLSPDARRLVESTNNTQNLRQALIDKGYTLHMVSVEPLILRVIPTGTESATPQEGQGRRSFGDTGAGTQEQKEDKRFT